jgi:beta-phosphoglucomutase
MSLKAFIFDLDGVIVDTAKYHFLAWKNLAEQLHIPFTHDDNEQLKGVSRVRSLEIILQKGNIQATDEQKNQWMHQKNDEYLQYIYQMDASEILPDVVKVLDYLQAKQQKIVLGSASKNARLILEKVNLLPYFDAIIDGNEVSKAKPDPEVFLKGAEKVDCLPQHCIVFEDAIAGIEAANAAKMTSIGIGDASILTEAQHVFPNFTHMPLHLIDELITKN